MVKNLRKKVSGILMAVSIFSLLGCSDSDKNQAADVENLLEDKYGQEFTVRSIGGRYGTATNDTVTTYVHPADNEKISFKAVMSKDGELVADSYIPRIISHSLNQILKQELQATGIESETLAVIMKANSSAEKNPDITLEEYVKTYKPGYFSADMIVKETPDLKAEQFEHALQAVYQAGLNTTFQVQIHVIAEDEYEKVSAEYQQLAEVSDTWFSDYNVVNEMKVYIDEKGFHVFEAGSNGSNEDGE
ncbi:hypothetical protein [Mesobacillus maritimus]|uniref:Lipoprotein n=1 Tax=Mesobacillus maritimus TaxID=1643336 RepID=A0ABS7KA94_9BACI|nr:hypothetical protein [Mesobacillus maritimus]MBY0099158.1 hypothetical protein [Mesobacillus maritimus]